MYRLWLSDYLPLPSLPRTTLTGKHRYLQHVHLVSQQTQWAVSDCLSAILSGVATDNAYVQALEKRLLMSELTAKDYPCRQVLSAAHHTDCVTVYAYLPLLWCATCND